MRTIAIHTSKGGVGKTTLTVNIAYELACRGFKVLVIDLDDQANSSLYLGLNKADELDKAKSMEDVNTILKSFEKRKEVIDLLQDDLSSTDFDYRPYVKEDSPFNKFLANSGLTGKVDVLPGSHRTKQDDQLTRAVGGGIREKLLNRALKTSGIAKIYDYVIIDTPPSRTMVGTNGLYAASYLIIPSQMEYFSVYGVMSVVTDIRKTVHIEMDGQRGKILGIVPTMTDSSKVSKLSKKLLQQILPSEVILPEIKRTTYFSIAAKERIPISVFAERKPKEGGQAAIQLSNLTDKLILLIDQDQSNMK